MFESDDWTLEDPFNNLDEKTVQSHSLCQSEEKTSSIKRRKVDNCKASSSSTNILDVRLDSVANAESNNPPRDNKSNLSRGNLLLGIFQENFSQEISDFVKKTNQNSTNVKRDQQCFQSFKISATSNTMNHKELKQKNHVKSTDKVDLNTRVKLHRIFPGPAGLVADMKKDNISVESYLNHMQELENKIAIKNENNLSKSQDEKNLFEETAWNLLLNDLPNNFLKEHSISAIKNKANASNCNSMKVKFIAGTLEYIDHSQDNPFIILKDSTGSIEGTIHHDILLNYPGVLEPNVVIFLNNVGLLKTTTYVVTNKYHILISEVNLLAAYSNKGRIVNTSRMKNILSNISNVESNRNRDMLISKHCINSNIDGSLHQSNAEYEKHEQVVKNNSKSCKIMGKVNEYFDQSMEIDDFCTIDCEFVPSEKENRLIGLSRETISQANKIRCSESEKRINHIKNTKTESVLSFQDNIKEQNLQKCVASVNVTDACHSRESCFLSNNNVALTREAYKDSNTKSISPVIKHNIQNSDISVSHFAGDNEYDSDDEMLSQLDVDNVL
ncbi:uncharacterized protein PF3D7_1120600-like [Linepithema humile]|uniref:uncharacterized protein PF3D7_1120600-like n=1 Tax=Linepithema humile TaxID=83485 RepID=UPI000623AB9B|nr:PREDICTED: uncharacterized protein LOC105676911 [Linepithema humile]